MVSVRVRKDWLLFIVMVRPVVDAWIILRTELGEYVYCTNDQTNIN
jgi:hypothetical protein